MSYRDEELAAALAEVSELKEKNSDLSSENGSLKKKIRGFESKKTVMSFVKKPIVIVAICLASLFVYAIGGSFTYSYMTNSCDRNKSSWDGGCSDSKIVGAIFWPIGLPATIAYRIAGPSDPLVN